MLVEFQAKAFLVGGFEQAWAEATMDLDGKPDDLVA